MTMWIIKSSLFSAFFDYRNTSSDYCEMCRPAHLRMSAFEYAGSLPAIPVCLISHSLVALISSDISKYF